MAERIAVVSGAARGIGAAIRPNSARANSVVQTTMS